MDLNGDVLSMKYSSVLLSSLRRIIVLILLLLSVVWMKKGYLELLYMTLLKWRDDCWSGFCLPFIWLCIVSLQRSQCQTCEWKWNERTSKPVDDGFYRWDLKLKLLLPFTSILLTLPGTTCDVVSWAAGATGVAYEWSFVSGNFSNHTLVSIVGLVCRIWLIW